MGPALRRSTRARTSINAALTLITSETTDEKIDDNGQRHVLIVVRILLSSTEAAAAAAFCCSYRIIGKIERLLLLTNNKRPYGLSHQTSSVQQCKHYHAFYCRLKPGLL